VDIEAAVAFGAGEPLKVETVQLEGPKAGEMLVEIELSGA
jgi:S-(hydroxymethyl)glutathione dehydrogenase/alcohol dehydrogenase